MKTKLDPARESWMRTQEVCAVIDALTANGGDARFVGGAVRNTLLDRAVDDIDIATPLRPDEVTRRLGRAAIAALPTGIEHGTITAIVNGRAFEVTTLRRDVSTDGRRAVVAFSDNWEEDAGRRDFTINALYASSDGELYDYHGGVADLAAGRIRFIGDPVQRIREDYLRVLRLFRFHAWYGKNALDATALRAAVVEREGLRILSGERIRKELLRLLEAANPLSALHVMDDSKILAEILVGNVNLDRLERLVAIDRDSFFPPDPLLRLIALQSRPACAKPELRFGEGRTRAHPDADAERDSAQSTAERLKLSNEERDRLVDLANAKESLDPYVPVREVRRLLYRLGQQRMRDRVRLAWADDGKPANTIAWRALLALCDAWVRPRFPLGGREVMAAGVPEGPLVGRVLAQIEEWWIDSDFPDDPLSLAERLKAAVQAVNP